MAPYTATHSPTYDSLGCSDKERIKLRKPLVEKMRRDRINSCIDQLKSLLEKEFHSQDPNAKLEKADILEMTVSFLKQQAGPVLSQRDFNQGYSKCWRDSVQFLRVSSSRGAPFRDHHSPQRAPQDLTSSNSSSSSSFSSLSSPVITTQTSVGVLHHAGSKRPVWRPWQ
ncbi:transcription factor HES-5-like [Clupea harengus]|uniref:Transcription factor HES-5 n=1 Tax=Clupea harengus TaxID=7950 RepID=A0A6P3VMU8_CLUHA|nr:transcription factor HES-5-like [Clupea harengus]